jgi:Kef-type K+ transport system membrane component KefB
MLAIIVLPMLGFSDYEALFLGMMTSLSSMLFVVSMVQAKKLVHTNAGKIMLAWVGFQSIVVVVWFLFLVQFAPNSTAQADPILAVVNSLLAMAGAYLLWKYILPFALLQVAKAKSEELLLLTVFAAVTVFAVMASVLELPAPIIAFLAGLMLAGVAKRYELLSGLKEFKGIFTLVFFVAIGALLDLSGLNENMALLLVILVIMLPIKIVVIIGINVWAKMHIKTAIKVGLGIGQIGELAFVVSYLAVHAGWIDGAIYSTVVAAAVVSMMLTPVLYLLVDWLYNFLERRMRSLSPNVHRGLFLSALPDEDDET